ncbi:hypothetical protein EBT16_05380 [bacterium]|nr:hypothetical protein [bacterium]
MFKRGSSFTIGQRKTIQSSRKISRAKGKNGFFKDQPKRSGERMVGKSTFYQAQNSLKLIGSFLSACKGSLEKNVIQVNVG